MDFLQKVIIITTVLFILFSASCLGAEGDATELSFFFGKQRDIKKNSSSSVFSVGTGYKGIENSYKLSYDGVNQQLAETEVDYFKFYSEIEKFVKPQVYTKGSYLYDDLKKKHNIFTSIGVKTKKFNGLVKFYSKFDGGISYSRYFNEDDYKIILNSNFISESILIPTVRFHQRFNGIGYDWWLQIEKEFKNDQLDILSFLIKFQWDHESYYNFTEYEEKFLVNISL